MKIFMFLITNNATTNGGAQSLRRVVLLVCIPAHTYDNKNNLQKTGLTYTNGKLTAINGAQIVYDAMGNPTKYKGNTFVWEQGRKLASGSMNGNSFSYTYDGNGMRYKKKVNGTNTCYYYNGTQLLMESTNGNRTYYIYGVTGIEGMMIKTPYAETIYYFDKNTLGDIVAIRDSNGNIVATYEYDAWGNCTVMNAYGTVTTSSSFIGNINPFRYRGYYYDTETGFYYLQTRYYDPTICRFINADNYELVATLSSVPGQLNMYAYCNNNPIMYTDPTGLWIETVFDLFSLGVSIVEVVINPYDPLNWAGLVGDALDLIPFVTGVGESVKGVKVLAKTANLADDTLTTIKMTKAVDNLADFADSSWDLVRAVDRTADGFTVSNHVLGTKIHKSFMNQVTIKGTRLRADGINDALESIYELKPYNRRSLRAGVRQLVQYRAAYNKSYNMILVFY